MPLLSQSLLYPNLRLTLRKNSTMSSKLNASQSSRFSWQRLLLVLALSLSSVGAIAAPAQAFDLLQPFRSIVDRYIRIFEGYYTRTVEDVLGSVLEDILRSDPGDLGIPDPPADWQELEQVIGGDGLGDGTGQASPETQRLDHFNTNPVVLQQSLANATDRESARGMANSVLGTEGQAAMKEEMEAAQEALEAIAAKSEEAQSLDVTQDVMKNLTDMVSHQSQLESGSYEQLMQLRQQSATSNLIEANISEALDEGNRAKHAEAMAGASQVVQAAANMYLPGSNN
jgi:hypothetical protein